MKQNVASQNISAQMTTVSDGSDFTGTVTVTVTKDNGTQTPGAGTVTHKGGGEHNYAPTQAETNAVFISFNFAGTGAITAGLKLYTQFPQSVDNATGIADIPTNAEFNARTRPTADYFDQTADSVIVGTMSANVINAASIAASAMDGKGDWNIGKTGYSLTITPPTAVQNRQEMDSNSVDLNTLISGQTTINNNVLLIPTTPMRGTDNALLAASINLTAGTIDRVTLVDTTTVNTDQRGTDSANTLTPDNAGITANGVAIAALNNITAAQVLAAGDIDGFSLEEAQKLILAASVGVLAGAATASITIDAADGSKTRITATVDADGNRSAVIKDVTG